MRRELSSIRALLRARELDRVLQGLELLRSLQDPGAWREMLDGVHYSGRFEDGAEPAGFLGPLRGPNALYAITHVLAHAQPDWGQKVRRLDLGPRDGPISVLGLSHLPGLEQLHVHQGGPFLELEGVLPALHSVVLERPVELDSLAWLLRAPRLRRLELRHAPGLDLGLALTVEELVLEDWSLRELGPLRAMRHLKRLELHTPAVLGVEPLLELSLEELRVGRAGLDCTALEAQGVRVLRTVR